MIDELPESLTRALEGRYAVESLIGEGAAARVYRARDLRHDRPVALKVLRAEVAAAVGATRFVDEIRTTATLRHPHILPLFDSGEAGGVLYSVTPLVEGETLRARLSREGRVDPAEALSIARDVGSALTHAHAQGFVHRDIKPANILLGEGGALVADFGVALALGPRASGADGAADSETPAVDMRLTATGLVVGTPRYMSPEQISGDLVDARSDLFALACVVYEMLTGRPPFEADSVAALVGQILTLDPPPPLTVEDGVPRHVSAAVMRGLAKDPGDRFPSAAEFVAALGPVAAAPPGTRRPSFAWTAAAVLVIAAVGVYGWRTVQRAEARSALVEVGSLVEQGQWSAAYDQAVSLERWIPGDTILQRILMQVSDVATVRSEPAGATVRIEAYPPASDGSPRVETLGVTPIVGRRLPRREHRMTIDLDGHVGLERILSTELSREPLVAVEVGRLIELDVSLLRTSEIPEGMVPVPGGEYQLVSPDAPAGLSHLLPAFAIDRFEVDQAAYSDFVEAGGYEDEALWSGVDVAIRDALTDRTGLPGPRGWTRGRPGEGLERHPVSGVTWFEARAYCQWVGKRLPSIYEWEKSSRDGRAALIGVVMPWGQEGAALSLGGRANFASSGTVEVDAFPFGVSPYGVYGMAGNVREWVANPSGDGRVTAGGSWLGPSYLFSEYTVEPADFASEGVGFRCASGPGDAGAEQVVELEQTPPDYTPVDDATYRGLLEYYRYDPVPARPRRAGLEETADWSRERTWIDGLDGDSILVYSWIPTRGEPPYQTVVYVASTGAFGGTSVPDEVELLVSPVVQAGRAVVAPVLRAMVERPVPGFQPPAPETVAFRDLLVAHVTELRLTVDYVATRSEFDAEALAYASFSFGAGSRLGLGVVEDRFDAVVFIGGGIDERVKPTLPEADNVNFAPRIAAPTLMVNGANDEEHPWATRGSALWNLLSEPKQLVLVDGGGHLPPLEARIPAINDFLDEVLGRVGRQ